MVYLIVFLAIVFLPHPCSASDPWYEDMGPHWAQPWVRLLWEEKVADGFLYNRSLLWNGYSWESVLALYRPDDGCTRAELTMLLAKAFGLTPSATPAAFQDVPHSLMAYISKPASPWIAAAQKAGLVFGTSTNTFSPGTVATREQAIAMLVRGLGLTHFVSLMDESHIMSLLSRFRDSHAVSVSLRREIAAAIYLSIVEGYPDGTLKPDRLLNRGEAATVVGRSCLIRVDASPQFFSPDGDGVDDQVQFSLNTLKNRSTSEWGLQVLTTSLRAVRWWNGWTGPSQSWPVPKVITWDGRDYGGIPAGNGTYFYQAWVRDVNGTLLKSALKPLHAERPFLRASATPDCVEPGGKVTISAYALPYASSVIMADSLSQLDRQAEMWSIVGSVPVGTAEGSYAFRVRAYFPSGAVREDTAYVTVIDPVTLTAQMNPAIVMPGQRASLVAHTSQNVTRVQAYWPWGGVTDLTRVSESQFACPVVIPSLPDETYQVTVIGQAGARTRTTVVSFQIDSLPLRQLVPSLVR